MFFSQNNTVSYHRCLYNISIILMLLAYSWEVDGMKVDGMKVDGMKTGGYSEADRNAKYIVDAANFAVTNLGTTEVQYSFFDDKKFVEGSSSAGSLDVVVLQAKLQVVAGMNYNLKVGLYNESTCFGAFEVIIYDRFGDLSITKFGDEISCDESDTMREEIDE